MPVKGFVLVKGPAERMKKYVKGRPGVKAVHIVYGGYDLVVEVEFKNLKELGRFVMEDIRRRFKVEDTLTLIALD